MIRKGEEELVEEMKAAGMEVTEPDVEEFKKAVEPVWTKYEDVLGKDLVDTVRKYSNK